MDVDGDDVIVAICTPLMKRIHRYIKHSAEIVFVDAGGSMDRLNMRVFLLMTFSVHLESSSLQMSRLQQ
jgi:hypothetical protein